MKTDLLAMIGSLAVVLAIGWLLSHPKIKQTALVFRFALAANLAAISLALFTAGSLMLFCISMGIVQLLILVIGFFLLVSNPEHPHFKSVALAICLLFTPYAVGLAVAVGTHQLWHLERENDQVQPPSPASFSP
jgi:hypothetical protein